MTICAEVDSSAGGRPFYKMMNLSAMVDVVAKAQHDPQNTGAIWVRVHER